jgi:hypothetical protein
MTEREAGPLTVEELRRLALEALGDGEWHNAAFLGAFIDDDDATVFSPEDCRFIEAASPSTVLRLLDAEPDETGLRGAVKAAADYLRDILEPGAHPYGEALERALRIALDAERAARAPEGEALSSLPPHAPTPRTAAGRRLLGKNAGSDRDPATVEWLANDIWAIETEAAARAEPGLREAVRAFLWSEPEDRNDALAALMKAYDRAALEAHGERD